ncbi:CDGSH iron-sulfur domain-containing protein [Klenkia sp. PcliD-1-E]|uniref:CDGSH iron-sulfur domain-containing protein n=1 Tax=Klenkia sp. PcliD-1-E TaxID=2954492 RepID=UPI00209814A7|nr:CDGSH iron-sulfur domain-containing protein [Klenkia sp. PcliD-1-E]MCO7220812.1 CDGSH iron-sulfur domain-containing protein [Klenkia sp. PcliD-1-E]
MPDQREPATITPYRDGPLVVRGDFRLVDADGVEFDPGRDVVALCRCGKSGLKPFCDGSHARTGFSAPSAPRSSRPSQRLAELEASDGDVPEGGAGQQG